MASDLVKLTGATSALTLAGNWTLQLGNLGVDPRGMSFVLFDGDTAAPGLNGFVASGPIATQPTFNYGTTGWSGGVVSYDLANNDLVLTAVIPEPGTAVSLVGGLASLLGLQRFRRRRS